MLGKTAMAELGVLGLRGPNWFCTTNNGVNCRNVTYTEGLATTPYERKYGVKKDVSKFRPFGCMVDPPE
jgi:hypothetical protein